MTRLAAWTLAGNLALHALPRVPEREPVLLLMLLAAVALALAPRLTGRCRGLHVEPARWLAGAACAALAFGWTALAAALALDARLPVEPLRQDVRVSGYVADFPRHDPRRSVFLLHVVDAPAGVPQRLRVSWYGASTRLRPGQGIHAELRLRPPRGLMNPGGGDYERWLYVNRIGATGYVRYMIDADHPVSAPWLLRTRAALAARLEEALGDGRAPGILMALTLGTRHALTDGDRDVLARTGTSHLMAISGLHVGLVAALGLAGVRRLWAMLPGPARRVAPVVAGAWAGLALAAAYALLAGFALPTRRALLMLAVVLLAITLRRSPRPLQGLALALVAVLALDPLATLDATFWLSFVAVAVIATVYLRRRRALAPDATRLRRWRHGVSTFLLLQALVVVGMAPATGILFAQVPLLSPPANAVLIPLFSLLLVPLALIGIALLVVVPAAGGAVLAVAAAVLDALWHPLAWLAAQPGGVLSLPGLPAAWWAVAAVAAWLVLQPRGWPARWLCVPLAAAALAWQPPRPAYGGFELLVLDVGHGLASFVRTRSHVLVFDTGPAIDGGFDAGRGVLVPALRHFGIRRVDLLMVSHEHNDHYGGAGALLAAMPVHRRLAGGSHHTEDGFEPCVDGQRWQWDGVDFEVLHPADERDRGNDGSCVLSVRGAGVSLLLTGDIEARAEGRLLAQRRLTVHDIVQVPHHGSLTSSHPGVVAATSPRWAVVGSGHANQWGFPRPEVVARWRLAGATVLDTGAFGALQLKAHAGGHIEVPPPWRERRRRYWHAPPDPQPAP